MIDLVLKSNLENTAKKLGYKKIYKVDIIDEKNLEKFRKKLTDFNIVKANKKLLRNIFENDKVNVVFGLESLFAKDNLHYRNSGLNQVLCKLAHKNKIIVGINLNDILNSTDSNREVILGRIIQNAKFCKKYKVKMIIISLAESKWDLRNFSDLEALARTLGIEKLKNKDILSYKKETRVKQL